MRRQRGCPAETRGESRGRISFVQIDGASVLLAHQAIDDVELEGTVRIQEERSIGAPIARRLRSPPHVQDSRDIGAALTGGREKITFEVRQAWQRSHRAKSDEADRVVGIVKESRE